RDERVDLSDARELIADVRREEREAEVREVDVVQQPPRQAKAQPQQPVQRADEEARQRGLREQRRAGQAHHVAPAKAGAQRRLRERRWIPACAGMTESVSACAATTCSITAPPASLRARRTPSATRSPSARSALA